jgi:hypothetical protein
MDLDRFTRQLGSSSFRFRTGLLLVPDVRPVALNDLAAMYRLEFFDMAGHLLQSLPPKTNFVGIGELRIRGLLTERAQQPGERDAALITNADILLAKLDLQQRERIYRFLETGLPRPATGLLVALPHSATRLLSASEQRRWEQNERLVII